MWAARWGAVQPGHEVRASGSTWSSVANRAVSSAGTALVVLIAASFWPHLTVAIPRVWEEHRPLLGRDRLDRRAGYLRVVSDDTWAALADLFADGAYATVKGYVRTYVMHQQLLEHLPPPPATSSTSAAGAGPSRSRWPRAAKT